MQELRALANGVANERESEDERVAIMVSLTETLRLTEEIKERLKGCITAA
ncbi:MAG: hypothetical protein L3J98_15350 [Gammaproteobacteria bacterium]|nr:hypothetical protein [Gammaproteobacteria bacterium]MCF6261515.1 hypothetical protein [Gammaproteobacteria bacterium]